MFAEGLGLVKSLIFNRGRTGAGEIRADLDQCPQLSVLLGSDDYPQVLLKFGIRLSPHKLFTN